jgi:hypothetical protein
LLFSDFKQVCFPTSAIVTIFYTENQDTYIPGYYVGIFPTMSHFQGGIFPTMSELFRIPILYAGKNPFFVDGRDPGLSHAKNTVGGSKNIPLTAEGIIRRM